MKRHALVLCALLFIFSSSMAQDAYDSKMDFGVGFGLDYGGLGFRLTGHPNKAIGVFGSVGYAFAGVGFNGGLNVDFNPKGRAMGYITAMYGYNAALKITGATEFNKLYYGPSFGLGIKLAGRRNDQNFLNFELLVPIRDDAFEQDSNYYRGLGVNLPTLPPVAFSVGYHFRF